MRFTARTVWRGALSTSARLPKRTTLLLIPRSTRALYWEFAAYRGDAVNDVKRGALAAAEAGGAINDGVATYHAASALATIHASKRAVQVLLEIDTHALPDYLKWRCWSLLGRCYEARGLWAEAAAAFEHSALLSRGADKYGELLNLAASRLEAQQPLEALEALESTPMLCVQNAAEGAVERYLSGRAHLLLGNPNTALKPLFRGERVGKRGG